MIGPEFQVSLIEMANAGDESGARAILKLVEIYDLGELILIDGMLNAAERWLRARIAAGSNTDCLQLCGVLIVSAARASQIGSVEAAISYAGEALCLLDVMADADDPDALTHMARLTDWMGSSDFGKAAIERAKAMRVEI